MSRLVLVVIGSRALAEVDAGERWARPIIRSALNLAALEHRELVVLTGGSRGPERWATQEAGLSGTPWVELLASGVRRSNREPESRWAPELVHPHRRAEALVEAALRAQRSRWRVQVLGLRASWSTSDGTGYALRCARRARLPVEVQQMAAPVGRPV